LSLLMLLIVIWPVSEIVLGVVKRARPTSARVRDRGSAALLWFVIAVCVTSAFFLQFAESGRMGIAPGTQRLLALGLLVAGLAIRWGAIVTLGHLFTTTVAVQRDHRVIRHGLYSRVRHPSYSGLLLAFAGLGVSFGNWFSLSVIMLPISAAVSYRIQVEERALLEAFGPEYGDYAAQTKGLIPWVYWGCGRGQAKWIQ
jgi:protein-S-isoprenylcysteine O-methyltransferase Ste14